MRFCNSCHRTSMRSILVLAAASCSSSSSRGKTFALPNCNGDLEQGELFFFGQEGDSGDEFSIFPVKHLNLFPFGRLILPGFGIRTRRECLNDPFPCILRRRRQVRPQMLPDRIKQRDKRPKARRRLEKSKKFSYKKQRQQEKFCRKIHFVFFVFCGRDF